MDYPLAIAIALPASTFIVTCGNLIGRAMNKSESGSTSLPVSRKLLDGILDKKFKHVRYVGECDAISEGIKSEMALTREVLQTGFKSVIDVIKDSR